jgi:sialic acid synthase SpsE
MQENILRQIKSIALKYPTDNIYIIGKGPSIDRIDFKKDLPGIAININDSEQIYRGDIGVFHADWVVTALKCSGYRCSFYLAGVPMAAEVNHEVLPNPDTINGNLELENFRLAQTKFYNEPIVLYTALKIADRISQIRRRQQKVYLLGFDFTTDSGEFSQKISADYTKARPQERALIVQSHENRFLQISNYYLKKGSLDLLHVGIKTFSAMSVYDFNQKFFDRQTNSSRLCESEAKSRVLVVAEFTNNHLGDSDRLVEMIHRAKADGADLIKVQKRDVNTFYTREQLSSYYWSPFGNTLGAYREGVELTEKLLKILDETCAKYGIEWFCSVLDEVSYHVIKKYRPKLIKIPSTISEHCDMHVRIAADYKGSIVVSTGFTEESYIQYVLETFAENKEIYLMHCVSAYPTPRSDCNVAIVKRYAEIARNDPRIIPSYSSHDVGSIASMLAVAAGAKMVEKHVKLGDVEWVHFDHVALDLRTGSFRDYVNDIRAAEEVLGSPKKRILASENHKYKKITQ